MKSRVVPLVGTWIEMTNRRGKSVSQVVPLVGTWIEIEEMILLVKRVGRAPRGHVD